MSWHIETTFGRPLFETPQEAYAFVAGFNDALWTYGIYKDGVQRIGCLEKPIKECELKLSDIKEIA